MDLFLSRFSRPVARVGRRKISRKSWWDAWTKCPWPGGGERPYLAGGGSRIAGYRYAALEFRDSTRILLQAIPAGKYGGIER